jgi:hypothetical protein
MLTARCASVWMCGWRRVWEEEWPCTCLYVWPTAMSLCVCVCACVCGCVGERMAMHVFVCVRVCHVCECNICVCAVIKRCSPGNEGILISCFHEWVFVYATCVPVPAVHVHVCLFQLCTNVCACYNCMCAVCVLCVCMPRVCMLQLCVCVVCSEASLPGR